MFRYRKLASALMVAGALNAGNASALGLGEMTMHSALNQPLDAEIKLRSVGDLDDVQILVSMADTKAFETAGIERTFFLNNIKFEVKLDDSGDGVIKLKSNKRLNEPFLDFLLDVKWPTGRVQRSYTALVDLPAYTAAEAPAVSLGKVEAVAAVKQAATQQAAVTTQPVTTVDVAAEEEMPVSDPIEETEEVASTRVVESSTSASSSTYQVQRDDTLWSVARRLKPSSDISVQQTMLAIQRMNEHAFIAGNINRLKAGEVIRVPSEQAVRDISARQAMAEVNSQNQQWQQAQLEATDSRQLTQTSAPTDEGYLRLSSAGTGSANGTDEQGSDGMGGQSAQLVEEQLEVSQRENEELSSRVDSLASQVEQLERLLELKDSELANLQQQLGQVNEEGAVETEAEIDAAVETDETVQEVVEGSDAGEAADDVAAGAEESAPEEAAVEEVVQEAPAEPQVSEPVAQPSLIDQVLAKPIYLGGVAIAILLLVAGFILRRKSKEEQQAFDDLTSFEFDAEDEVSQTETDADALMASEDTAEVDAIDETDVEEVAETVDDVAEETPETTTMQTGDAIGEADIYIAYGRYEQAAELLQNAIAASPDEVELRTKLLEVYLESQNKEGFQQQFLEIQSRGFDGAVSHAKELLTSVEGASGWLDDLSAEAPAVEDATPDAVDADEELLDLDLDLDDSDSLADELDLAAESEMGEEISLDLDDDLSEDLSLDLDEEASDDLSLDLDTQLSEDATQIGDAISIDDALLAEPSSEELTTTEPAVELENVDESTDMDLDLDLDLDLGDFADDSEAPAEEESAGLDLDLDDDLSLDLSGIDETNLASTDDAAVDSEPEEDVLEFDGFDLSDVTEEAEPETEAVDASDDFDLDLDLDLGADNQADVAEDEVAEPEVSAVEDDLDLSDFDLGDLTDDEPAETLSDEAPVDVAEPSTDVDELNAEAADFDLSELDDVLSDLSLDEEPASEPQVDAADVEETPAVEESPAVEEEIAPQSAPEPVAEADLAALEGDDLEFLGDADEVSTKLDLAQAYVEMGDVDGARDILMEVMKEGNESQKTEASSLLDSID